MDGGASAADGEKNGKLMVKYTVILVASFVALFLIQYLMSMQKKGSFDWGKAAMTSLILPGALIVLYFLYWVFKKYA